MCKNEAPTIAQTLESARELLPPGSPIVVLDTGSTDQTIAEVERWGVTRPSGELTIARRPFDNFSASRNALLHLGHTKAPLVCMADAGMVMRSQGKVSLPTPPLPGKVTFRLGAIEYERVMIMPEGWRFVGAVHEYNEGPGLDRAVATGLVYDYCLRDGGARGRRWLRDLALLESDFTPRGRYYYAQTLHCLGRNTQALRAYWERYEISKEGFWQERVVAMLNSISIAPDRGTAERYARLALELDPSRGEAWLELCPYAEERQDWAWLYSLATKAIRDVPREGALFVNIDRAWRANVYAGDASSSRGDFASARWHWARALELAGDRMPAHERAELTLGVAAGG